MSDSFCVHDQKKHPEFDKYWLEHKNLVWWMSKKLSERIHGFGPRDFVGSLTLWFNHVIYSYDPDKGKFSTYFLRHCYSYVFKNWVRRESQSWDNFVKDYHKSELRKEMLESQQNYATHEIDFHLYRVPEQDESDMQAVIECFDTVEDCWEFMTRYLDKRDKEIVSLYFRDDLTLQQIGDKFQISKERVRQLLERIKKHIRQRLFQIEALADLFKKEVE